MLGKTKTALPGGSGKRRFLVFVFSRDDHLFDGHLLVVHDIDARWQVGDCGSSACFYIYFLHQHAHGVEYHHAACLVALQIEG